MSERPDTNRLREASRVDRDHWWPRDYEAIAAAADWIDAQPGRAATIPDGLRELVEALATYDATVQRTGRTTATSAAAAHQVAAAARFVVDSSAIARESLLAAAPPTAEPEPDERVCPATSTRPPDDAREQYRRHRLACPECGRNVGMVGGFIARHHRGEPS